MALTSAGRLGPSRPTDVVAVVLAVVFAAMSLVNGLNADRSRVDVDQAVYTETLKGMQAGESYYDATRTALAEKEGAPPSQVRSVRPPTLYLLLRWFPEASWKWMAGAVGLAVLLLAWALARDLAPVAGPLAVVLVGAYVNAALGYLYLHAELWGLPFAMGSLLAMRHRRWAIAAACLVAAISLRELYVVFLFAALLWLPRRRPFVVATAALVPLVGLHLVLASRILVDGGREAPFGEDSGLVHVVDTLGPGGGPFGWTVGLAVLVAGTALLVVAVRRHELVEAPVALTATLVLALAATTLGRTYWGLTFAPPMACYAAGAIRWWPRSTRRTSGRAAVAQPV